MAVYKLEANEKRRISTSSRFLNVLSIGGAVEVDSPSYDLKPVRVRSGWQLDLDAIPEVFITNLEGAQNIVEMQDAGIKISLGGGGGVTIENKPVIQRIEEGLNVTANATVTGGSFTVVTRDIFTALSKVTISAGERAQFAPARVALDRKVTIQIVSDNSARAVVNVGNDATIDETKGVLLVGNINAIAAYEVSNQSAVWIYNSGAIDAVIMGVEEYSTFVAPSSEGGE
jgi:hypothetical protein